MNILDGIKFEACLDANVYRLKRNGNWVAKILMNGEMTVATQEATPAPLGLTEWRTTDGTVYAKGANAVDVQAGILKD